MLRTTFLVFSLLVLVTGLLLLYVQLADALSTLIFGGLLTLVTLIEQWRYKRVGTAPAAKGIPTGERFIDPVSKELIEVYYDAASGERSYTKVILH